MIRSTFAISLALITATSIRAQQTDTTRLGTVVVSASKVPTPATTLTQAVTVLSGADLRARGVTRVVDALREVPGAALVQSGSYGAITSLFLRGGESRYTKVLIDGVPVNASGGSFDFSNLTTDNIDRIEIVRGPASVLYGADAVSGVVQIFTRPSSGQSRASVAVRGGTYRSLDAQADGAAESSLGGLSVGAAHHSTDGILPFNNQYRNGTLSSALSLGHGAAGDARLTARYTAAEFHYPTDFTGAVVDSNSYNTQHRLTVGLDTRRNLSAYAQAKFLAGANELSALSADIATPFGSTSPEYSESRSKGYRRYAETRVSLFLPTSATLTSGVSYEKEHERSSNAAGPVGGSTTQTNSFDASRHTVAYYSELLGNPSDRFAYTLSGRVDDNSDYHRFATYRIGASVGVLPALSLRGSLSNAFNAPAFNELRPTLYTLGSPDLKPERIRSAEIGITTTLSPELVRLSANYFTQRYSDLIQYVNGAPPDYKGSYANLTAASSNGYEAELALFPLHALSGSASYTIVNPRVSQISPAYEGSDRAGDALIRRPSHSGNFLLSYARPAGPSAGLALHFVGRRPDMDFREFPAPRVTLPAYTKTDLSADMPVAAVRRGGLVLNARVENLFDKRYEDVLNFVAPRRTVLVGARATTLF